MLLLVVNKIGLSAVDSFSNGILSTFAIVILISTASFFSW